MKKILLISTNKKKQEEFNFFFMNYGIEVELFDSNISLKEYISNQVLDKHFLIMKEETFLLRDNKNVYRNELNNFDIVETYSYIDYYFNFNIHHIESQKIKGFIDLSQTHSNHKYILGWDDIFITADLGISLQELKKKNVKNIGRQLLLSQLAKEILYYNNRLDLNFNKQEMTESICFNFNTYDFLTTNKYFNLPSVKESGFTELLKKSLNNGAIFRSAKNRREKNYWFPGLNAGLPLVAKKDEIHEITFAAHDFMHFTMPDLIFDGRDDIYTFKTYIFSRMISEAITLTLADGWFISNLQKEVDYNFSDRKIYPLFKDINLNNLDILKKEVIPNIIKYCLTGQDQYLLNITNDIKVLSEFKNKYDAFFVEDYKWTIKNYENMRYNHTTFQKWYDDLNSIFIKQELDSVSSVKNMWRNSIQKNNYYGKSSDIVDYLTEYMIDKCFKKQKILTKEEMLSNSFKKYMLGQMFIFYKFDFIGISEQYKNIIKNLLSKKEVLNNDDIRGIRTIYNLYLEKLNQLNLIDNDQLETYKEVFPLFDPFFVFYNKEKEYYDKIETFYEYVSNGGCLN